MSKKQVILEGVDLGKLVHGGQCIAEAENGKAIFVWGGLPGENVNIKITKKKSSYMEGIVNQVNYYSPDRIDPKEPKSYLSTSPWQIMTYDAENSAKQAILVEAFEREGVSGVLFEPFVATASATIAEEAALPTSSRDKKPTRGVLYNYRNKNEFGFWGSEDGLHLAHYVRGTNGKQMVEGSALVLEPINQAARDVRDELQRLEMWGGKLKTVLIRCSQSGDAVAALFLKEELDSMSDFQMPKSLKGIDIYYSNPKSPASVATKKLYSLGDTTLTDTVGGIDIIYDVLSFFQVNIPIFELVLDQIKTFVGNEKSIDFYSGVGTIGLAVGSHKLIESDDANIAMAQKNTKNSNVEVVHATSETAVDYIVSDSILIVDPPRAGLHKEVVARILEVKPPKIVYLSCNPSTQARDIKLLEEKYKIVYAQGYNFFPRTPHIESLFVLKLR